MKYRIPKIEEFVDGFEYQVAYTQKLGLIDFLENPITYKEGESQTIWINKVYKQPDNIEQPYMFKDNEGNVYTFIRSVEDYENLLQTIKTKLENGKIRTKIN